MPFHWSSKNNRSQHNLVGTTADDDSASSATGASGSVSATGTSAGAGAGGSGAGAANPPVALSNPAFSSSESFQQQHQQQQQPPPPPPHLYNNPGASGVHPPNISSLQHSNTVSGSLESRQPPRDLDFADSVSRSQSQRYPQGSQISPVTTQYSYSQQSSDQQQQQQQQFLQQQQRDRLGLGSLEDLSDPGAQAQGQAPQQQQAYFPHQQQQQQQQQQQAPPPKGKQSVGRKLIKNILGGSSSSRNAQDGQHHHSHHSFSSHTGLGRRSSKRVSESPAPPPAIRTGNSQLSLEQTIDWQTQHQQPTTQHSPLQNSAEFSHESFADQQHSNPNPTIRSIPPSDTETSPYSPDDVGFHHRQAQLQLQGQIPSDHQQYNQAAFDSSPLQQQQQQQHAASLQQQYQFAGQQQQQQQQYQTGNQQHYSRHLGSPSQHENPETVSQFSHESPVTDSDQRSATNVQPPPPPSAAAVKYADETRDLPARPNPASGAQAPAPQQQPQSMAPPAGGPPPPRRSQDAEKGLRGDQVQPPPGPPPSYRQSQAPPNMNNPLPAAPNSAGGAQNPNYRAGSAQDRAAFDTQGDIQGRNSPQPPSSDRGEDPEKAFKDLLTKYKNVKRLYFDGKKEIELLNGQVEQLQNAIANQRMSQSRTSLDDSEYTTRFNRLNGAINNLAFNIRKHWVSLPAWLDPYVSADAIKTGKQEMTAVGRAVITRWLVDEIFHRCFHPGLDIELSRQLKAIEQNIRHFSYTRSSQEELEALTSKVVGWRMATLEGLQDVLRSNESAVHKAEFTQAATNSLINCLQQHVKGADGVDGSAGMIVELAVGIAANMPMESRDVAIVYPLPESQIDPNIMDVEKTGLPVLEARASDASEEGAAEENGKDGKDAKGRADKARAAAPQAAPKDSNKVRFAGFVAVEVRGRQVLVKSTVWAM